jgi:hypothetical protein
MLFFFTATLKLPQISCEKRFAKFEKEEIKPIIAFVAPRDKANSEMNGDIKASANDLKKVDE